MGKLMYHQVFGLSSLVLAGLAVWRNTARLCVAALILSLSSFAFYNVGMGAIAFVLAGLTLAIVTRPDAADSLRIGLSFPSWSPPVWDDFVQSFPRAALPQIPLSTLNSVIAVCALATDLFPDRPVKPRRVAVSVGVMNMVACVFGGMPMCHGAGGLAGQHRFGARTNGSILFLGGVKMAVAVLLGAPLMVLCQAFPGSILGVMLAFSGIELAMVTRDQVRKTDAFVMLLTAGACLGLTNMAAGFVIGWVLALVLRLPVLGIERARD